MSIIVAANYNLLPDASLNAGRVAQVTNTLDDFYRGYYVSDGTAWIPGAARSDALRAKIEEIEDMVDGMTAPSLTLDDIAETSTKKHFTATEKTKLGGVATGATANASDAALTDRANHTGTQPMNSVSGLDTALAGKQVVGSYAAAAHSHAASDVTGLPAALTKLAGIKFKRAEAFSGTTDANGDITVNTSAAFTNPRAFGLPAGSSDGVGYSLKLISKSGTALTFRAYKTQITAVVLLNTNVDPDIAAATTAVDLLVVEPE